MRRPATESTPPPGTGGTDGSPGQKPRGGDHSTGGAAGTGTPVSVISVTLPGNIEYRLPRRLRQGGGTGGSGGRGGEGAVVERSGDEYPKTDALPGSSSAPGGSGQDGSGGHVVIAW
ncbi:hypothetical protein CRV15_29230 (plasmid) [Streptomyces clavuligerus]|nr:hypothetical protein SSCG_03259 [Streptomyces clavuligerus]MBY6307740.1 hypothetical protein [Streptomyces clavuligerus]QCS09714.1 hypothetical protein CRV15_29230 [Streptomyces clavuligerus]QPJ98241.1 hypothetical protein GE265_35155 [Streptomyces clavuligerus]